MSLYYPTPDRSPAGMAAMAAAGIGGQVASNAAKRFADRAADYMWQQVQHAGANAYAGAKRGFQDFHQFATGPVRFPKRRRVTWGSGRGAGYGAYGGRFRRAFGRRRMFRRGGRRGVRRGRGPRRYGRSLGKFNKRTSGVSKDLYQKYGSVRKMESGDTLSDVHCLYAGVASAPTDTVVNSVARSLIKRLAQKMDIDFEAWEVTVPVPAATWDIQYTFYPNAIDNVATSRVIAMGAPDTWATVAFNLSTDWATAIASTQKPVFERISIRSAGTVQELATIKLKQFRLDICTSGRISIQNRTPGGTTVTEEDNRNDVTANPLIGRIYIGSGNGFVQRSMAGPAGTGTADFIASTDYGEIRADAANSLLVLRKPPPASFFIGAKSSGTVKLNPGVVKTVSVYRKQKMAFNTFMGYYTRSVDGPGNGYHWSLGKSVMIGLEKAVDARSTEPDVLIGYQYDVTVKVRGNYSNAVLTTPQITLT